MDNRDQGTDELLKEIEQLRARVHALEQSESQLEQAETALRESETKLRTLFENMPDFVLVVDRNAIIQFVNRPSPTAPEQKLVGTKGFAHIVEEDQAQCEKALKQAFETGNVCTVEARTRYGGWWDCRIVPLPVGDGEPMVMILCIDMSQHHKAEQMLRDSERKYRRLTERVNDLPYTMSPEGILTYVGPQVARFGYTPEQMISRPFLEFVDPADHERLLQEFQTTAANGSEFPSEFRIRTVDGQIRWLEDEGSAQTNEDGEFIGLAGILRDVTDRKLAEEAVREEQRHLRRLLEMHERDKRLVAYEIHDAFIQPLTGAKMVLEGVESHVRDASNEKDIESFQRALDLLSRSIDGARQLISGQRPMILDEKGLLAAIQHLAYDLAQDGSPEIECTQSVRFERLAAPLETAVFRIVQESLNNVSRHAKSPKIRIALEQRDDLLRVEIQDWGVGFDPAQVSEDRFGLEGIRERARLFGGKAMIESIPDKGTTVVVELPLVSKFTGDESGHL
jgi:PAS domain S-box-containing protein